MMEDLKLKPGGVEEIELTLVGGPSHSSGYFPAHNQVAIKRRIVKIKDLSYQLSLNREGDVGEDFEGLGGKPVLEDISLDDFDLGVGGKLPF